MRSRLPCVLLLLAIDAHADDKPQWTVYERTSPCPDSRIDWMTVAKEQPVFGLSSFVVAPGYVPTTDFAAAQVQMDSLRAGDRFRSVCCKDWEVWKKEETKQFAVVRKMGNPGLGWSIEKGMLCCEEAQELAGIPGACNAGLPAGHGRPAGYLGCYKDPQNPFDLDGYLERSTKNSPERCIKVCRDKGFAFAGVQYGQSCLCGNSYGKSGTQSNCNMKCTGNRKQTCGGYESNEVYATGLGLAAPRP